MKSHTIPKRLLKQFAFHDHNTKSLRLWRYSKGRKPDPTVSPKTAARIDGYFANPADPSTEGLIEKKLADEIEDPVHKFMDKFDDSSWTMSETQQAHMTRYVSLLFNRCVARKEATKHTQDIIKETFLRFVNDEVRVRTVATHWSLKALERGQAILITQDYIRKAAAGIMARMKTETYKQGAYAQLITEFLTGSPTAAADKKMTLGEWNIIRTSPDRPFILSDTPVVTWERVEDSRFEFGIGFERPNVEVILPVSPTACLQILPNVKRTKPAVPPTVAEVNTAQAAFARNSCFADRKSDGIDQLVQENVGKLKMGTNVFTIGHRNFDDVFYDLMMSQG